MYLIILNSNRLFELYSCFAFRFTKKLANLPKLERIRYPTNKDQCSFDNFNEFNKFWLTIKYFGL